MYKVIPATNCIWTMYIWFVVNRWLDAILVDAELSILGFDWNDDWEYEQVERKLDLIYFKINTWFEFNCWLNCVFVTCVRFSAFYILNYYLIVVSFKQLQLTNSLDGVLTESFRKTKHVTETLKR